MTEGRRLAGKLAVVTGARGGIGTAICERFLREGAEVVAADLTADPNTSVKGLHQRVVDVTSEDSVRVLAEEIAKNWPQVDILVNNAGAIFGNPLMQTAGADVDHLMAVNVKGPLAMMRAIVPLMPSTGTIVNMSSVAAAKPLENMGVYSAAKAALSVMSRVAAAEMAPIRVNSVLPGTIDTAMPRAFLAKLSTQERDARLDKLRQGRSLGRFGEASEVASMVMYLASDESAFVTGSDFVIDGGRL